MLPAHGSLRAAAVSSSCSFNRKTGVVTGRGTVTGGRISRPGAAAITLPASPAPNTRMVIRGLAVIILNRQYTGPAGTLTTEALRVRMLRGRHEKLVFATSVCVRADLAAIAPVGGRTIRLTLGGLGLLVLGGIAYVLSGSHEHTSFDFLGFTFRARGMRGRHGKVFTGFGPAVSKTALTRMRGVVRSWRLHHHL